MPNDLVRSYPIPHGARLHEGVTFNILKSHPAYFAAKNGDVRSAAAVVRAYAPDVSDMPPGMSFLPVAALDRYGSHNALPVALATYLASKTDGRVHLGVVQTNRAGHTGARAMERLVSRAYFDGSIDQGREYILVDDVATLGSTLADLADHVQRQGGIVRGLALLADNSRNGIVPTAATRKTIDTIGGRHEGQLAQSIREEFLIDIAALTCDEAGYLVGFRSVAELRNSASAARAGRAERVSASGFPAQDLSFFPRFGPHVAACAS